MSISQNFPTSRPSLNINFARSKTLDPRITFTRSSSAIFTDKDGIVRTSPVNTPRFDHDPITGESLGLLVEEQRTNLVPLSNLIGQTSAYSTATNTIILGYNSLAPDNTFTATLIDNNGNTGTNYVYGAAGALLSTNTTYTYSIFIKQGTKSDFQITIDENGFGGKRYTATFTFATEILSTGVTGNVANNGDVIRSSYIKYPNGWYRITLTFRTSTSSVSGLVDMISRFGNSGSVYVWGRQLEVGSFPSTFIPTIPTFGSRASIATYYDSTGTLRTAGNSVVRSDAYFPDSSGVFRSGGLMIEGAATNLFTNSSLIQRTRISFPDAWDGWNPATIFKSQTLAPDAISYGLFHGAINQNGGGLKRDLTGLTASTAYTISFWARSITSAELTYFTNNNGRGTTTGTADGAANVAWFAASKARVDVGNLNGTGATGSGQEFVLSNTWKRFYGNITTDSAGSIRIIISNNVNDTGTGNEDGGGVWMIWGPQLEQNVNMSSYIPATPIFTSRASSATYYDSIGILRTAATDVVRNNAYLPDSTGALKYEGLILENAATNLALNSEALNSWANNGSAVSISANSEAAPDGTRTADVLSQSAVTGASRWLSSTTRQYTAGTTYTMSIWLKKISGTNAQPGINFWVEGALSSSVGSITTEWKRYSVTFTPATTVTNFSGLTFGWNDQGVANNFRFAAWGFQIETGSIATSYIQTTSTTATRAADVASYPSATRAEDLVSSPSVTRTADTVTLSGTNFSSFYNQSEGTFLWEGKFNIIRDDNDTMFSVNNGTAGTQRFSIRRGNVLATTTGANYLNGLNTGLTTNLGRVAFAYKSGSYALVTNGTITATSGATEVPTPDRITQFNAYEGDVVRNSVHHRKLVYYPFRLSNAQLQAITK